MVAGHDTRRFRPAELAGEVATLFQDPEDQVVFGRVENEVAFGLENVGAPPDQIWPRVHAALAEVGAERLAERRTETLSGGELQRVCLASVLALEPALLLLDEPTSQLDPEGAEAILDLACELGAAVARLRAAAGAAARALRPRALRRGRADRARRDPRRGARPPAVRVPAARARSASRPRRGEGDVLCRLDERVLRLRRAAGARRRLADAAARRDRRADGPERRRARRRSRRSPPGCSSRSRDASSGGAAAATSRRIRAATSSGSGPRTRWRSRSAATATARARALAEVGLAGFEHRHPRDLSSGERERLALASVLVAEPDVLILDEPTRGVDPPRKAELAALLRRDAQSAGDARRHARPRLRGRRRGPRSRAGERGSAVHA